MAQAVAQQNAAIKEQLARVSSLVAQYTTASAANAGKKTLTVEEQGEQSRNHTAVVQETHKLLHAIKGPVDTVYCHFENAAHTGAVRALFEMGVFHALPQDGTSKTAETLATELNAEKELIIRLMRMATIWGPFKEVGEEEYAQTPDSLIYLDPKVQSLFKLMADEYLPAQLQFSEFFKLNGWVSPTQDTNNPYTFANRTGGKTMWQFIAQFPDRLQTFNDAMRAQSSAGSWAIALYPFHEVLSRIDSTDDTPLVVDIGGGKGHALCRIKELCGDAVKGRFILQDRQEVVDVISGEELAGIEREAYNFFTPQPVKGAAIYYLRRVLHDWPDAVCVQILKNVAAAITDKTTQRVVIAEDVLPEQGADAEAVWLDLAVMALAGTERTEKQWRKLLDDAGFRLERTFVGPGSNYAAVEAFLK